MTTLVRTVTDVYDEYIASGDPRVTNWLFMEGPGPTFFLVTLYVLFVKKIGPAWMMDRKPFDLRYPMFLYNAVLVLTNFYLIMETIKLLFKPSHSWICRIDDKTDPDALRLAELGWWFYFIKFIEFADTIFFVLRKKNNHISTLHVVHHATVPIAVWGGLRIEPGSYNYFFPLINTMVHTVMYAYYGLAALGPGVQKYLWWKKYLTTFQIIQFVMVFFYVMSLMLTDCKVSRFIIYLNTFLAGLFLIMFLDYFQNTYLKKKAKAKQLEQNGHAKSNGKAVENRTAVEKSNGKAVENRTAVEKSNGKAVENRTAVEKSNGKAVENRTAVDKSNGKAVENRTAVEKSNGKAVENRTPVEKSNGKAAENRTAVEKSNDKAVENRTAVDKSNGKAVENRTAVEKSNGTLLNGHANGKVVENGHKKAC